MHVPDGFLTTGTAITAGALSASTIGIALRQTRTYLQDRQIPLAGLAAAFVFAAQMFNFPVAAGTTGHLLGGALAAILLGPATGALVVTVVVVVQALAFADGGLTALGINVLNLAIVPAFGGYAVFVLFRRLMSKSRPGVVAAAALASFVSVVFASMAFSIEWLFGATAPIPFDRVFAAMTGVHVLIGIGEAVITGLVISSVLAARPDLVFGARGLSLSSSGKVRMRAFVAGGLVVILFLAAVVSQFSSAQPDGLESVAAETGIAGNATESPLAGSWFADYATEGVENGAASLAVAGFAGTLIVLAIVFGLFAGRKPTRRGRLSVEV